MRLQPITRKERFLTEIVGWGETAPEKPTTPEEFFFASILGEAVQAPEPLTRYQMYLAKIAGRNISVPKPLTRLELFLAKACGMDIETPTPITREEIFWSNYSAIVDFEVEGVPPLTFKSNGANLSNYRIYGNTVGGESVGDLVENGEHSGEYVVPVKIEGKNLIKNTAESTTVNGITFNINDDFSVTIQGSLTSTKADLTLSPINDIILDAGSYIGSCKNAVENCYFIFGGSVSTSGIRAQNITDSSERTVSTYTGGGLGYCVIRVTASIPEPITLYPMIRRAEIADGTYEPYHAPTITNIYLPEQIKKVGSEYEYIDYAEQKQYFAGGTSADVILPALPTFSGTNTLTIGTAVQPSKVGIKGKVEGIVYGRAVFGQLLRTFTVYFYNGSTLLQTSENVQYGGTATYTGETPIKDGFTFSGWQPSNVNITADTSCYAQFVEG